MKTLPEDREFLKEGLILFQHLTSCDYLIPFTALFDSPESPKLSDYINSLLLYKTMFCWYKTWLSVQIEINLHLSPLISSSLKTNQLLFKPCNAGYLKLNQGRLVTAEC